MTEGFAGYRLLLSQRGMALLLVVSVISLLTVVILNFSQSVQYSLVEASRYQDREVLENMAQSGIDIGLAVLHADRLLNEHDTLLEEWSRLGEEQQTALFGEAELTVEIVNLDGRFPINSLVALATEGQQAGGDGPTPEQAREVLLRLLLSGVFAIESESEAREIVDSLVDWIDGDDNESPFGAENGYYETLEKPYQARNDMVEFLEELLLVKGVTPELLFGTDEKAGLAEYISVYGTSGKININTAPSLVFRALDERISEEDAELIDAFKQDEGAQDSLINSTWYLGVAGWPGDIVIDSKLLSTSGLYFQVNAEALYRESRMRISAVVKRADDKQLETLFFKVD